MKKVFEFDQYISFIEYLVKTNHEQRGFQSRLAKAMGCQTSFISQLLKGFGNLSMDQTIGFCQFASLDQLETEYFLTLVLKNKTSNKENLIYFEKKLNLIKKQNQHLKNKLDTPLEVDSVIEATYYSHWSFAAIHIICSQPNQTLDRITVQLLLNKKDVELKIQFLAKHGFIQNENGFWIYNLDMPHLSDKSNMNTINHFQWRMKSINNIETNKLNDLRYTSVFTCSQDLAYEIRNSLIELIKLDRIKIQNSNTEILMSFNLDFFKV